MAVSYPLALQSFEVQGLSVELFVPDADAVRQSWRQGRTGSPYWSQVWPSALALAGLLARQPQWVRDKSVLELAAGLGLPSLVAARWAASVLCTDREPEAVSAAERSAAHNGSSMQCAVMDWSALPHDLSTEVLLLSDVNYEPAAFGPLQAVLQRYLEKGATVLLSTPQRLVARAFIEPLLPFLIFQETETVLHQDKEVPITIMILRHTS